MGILGKPQGLFDLHNSDTNVGSMLSRVDIEKILGLEKTDTAAIPFKDWHGIEVIDEREIQKLWYTSKIPNSPTAKIGNATVSLDEMILVQLIKIAYPDSTIEHQVPWGRKRIDLKVTVDGKSKLIEFHGPSHFAPSRFDPNPESPFIRKEQVEAHFGIECVIWPYWIQRCSSNVRAIFDQTVNGLGVLWSTNIHFGSFLFPDAAQVIDKINDRFRAKRNGGCAYFYGPNSEGRNNPEHPIINQIRIGKKSIASLIPKGCTDEKQWLPESIHGKA